jgi:hypothetical protein
LVSSIEALDEPTWQQAFEIAHKNDVVFAVEVNPAAVAVVRVTALRLAGGLSVEDVVELLFCTLG